MIAFALSALLSASAYPTDFTLQLERLSLTATGTGALKLEVDPLRQTVTVENANLSQKLSSTLCSKLERQSHGFVLHCDTRRIVAALCVSGDDCVAGPRASRVPGAKMELDLRQTRGLPPLLPEDELPLRGWPLIALGLPDTCPGSTVPAQAECAYAAQDFKTAFELFNASKVGADSGLAKTRLGDLALAHGELSVALGFYEHVTFQGAVGRMAGTRACEVSGACLTEERSEEAANVEGLPEPLKSEMEQHTIRREALGGRLSHALELFSTRIALGPPICDDALGFCQKLCIAGLESPEEEDRTLAMATFLTDKFRVGPHQQALADAVARAAEKMGAPSFAAAVLAAATQTIAEPQLDEHLLRVVRLYLAGGDRVRAGVIYEYAESKLGTKIKTKSWQSARQQIVTAPKTAAASEHEKSVKDGLKLEQVVSDVDLTRELAQAAAMRSRALTANAKEEQP